MVEGGAATSPAEGGAGRRMPRRRPGRRAGAVGAPSTWPMWVLGLVVLIDNIDSSVVRGMVINLEHAFGVGDFAIGILGGAFVLLNGLVTVPAGYLADRWHRTRTMGFVIAVWSVLSALGGAAPAFWLLVGFRSLLGFGQATSDPSANSLIADYYVLERRGRAFSIQQCMSFLGLGLGVTLAGAIAGPAFVVRAGHRVAVAGHWRLAFVISAVPGLLIAYLAYRLKEPKRGDADRAHVAGVEHKVVEDEIAHKVRLFDNGLGTFFTDMVKGLRDDLGVVIRIPTMRYALVGVSFLLFVVTAIGYWLNTYYQRQFFPNDQAAANRYFLVLAVVGGISGVLVGGRVADRLTDRIKGARMAIPAVCLSGCVTLFLISYLRLPFGAVFPLEIGGFFLGCMSIPALRAGLSDAVPAHLRGAGFGAFNLFSVVFGIAAAPVVVGALSSAFGSDLRTAFVIVTPFAYIGAVLLFAARRHLDADTAAIFSAVVAAMQAEQALEAQRAAARAVHEAQALSEQPAASVD